MTLLAKLLLGVILLVVGLGLAGFAVDTARSFGATRGDGTGTLFFVGLALAGLGVAFLAIP